MIVNTNYKPHYSLEYGNYMTKCDVSYLRGQLIIAKGQSVE